MIVDCSNLIQLEIGNTTQSSSSSSSPLPDNNMFTAVEQVTVRSTIFNINLMNVDLENLVNLNIGSNTFTNATTAIFTQLPNITQLTINDGSMNAVETLQLSGVGSVNTTEITLSNNTLSNLKVISIGEEDDNMLAEVLVSQVPESIQANITITTDPVLPTQTAVIFDCDDLLTIPGDIKTLLFANDSCNNWNSTELDLRRFVYVQIIDIGSNALMDVERVYATGLRNLMEMNVGEYSLVSVSMYVQS